MTGIGSPSATNCCEIRLMPRRLKANCRSARNFTLEQELALILGNPSAEFETPAEARQAWFSHMPRADRLVCERCRGRPHLVAISCVDVHVL
jgi:hypothetical protein